jgi:hypothetical protein
MDARTVGSHTIYLDQRVPAGQSSPADVVGKAAGSTTLPGEPTCPYHRIGWRV